MSSHAERPAERFAGPLSDIRVLELGTLIAGPFAGRWFADFGAEVDQDRAPGVTATRFVGGARAPTASESLWHLVQSRGKRSVAADLHDPADQAFVRRLALESDILIENFRPGRLERWNLDPEDLIAANPRLIVVRISGYGQTGPLREQPGFGTIAEAAGGLRYITGEPDGPPTRVGLSLGDSIASMHALVGALIALHERERSGRGQIVDVALTESLFTMLEVGPPRVRLPRDGPRADRQHRPQLGADQCLPVCGRRAGLHRREHDATVPGLFRAIGRDGLRRRPGPGTNQGRVRRAAELDAVIGAWTSDRTADEVVALLREHQIPVSRINSIADIAADPQFLAREMIVAVDDDRLDATAARPGHRPEAVAHAGSRPSRWHGRSAPTRRRSRRSSGGAGDDAVAERPGPSTADQRVEAGRPTSRLSPGWASSRHSGGRWTGRTSGPSLIHEHVFVRNLELEGSVRG